MCKTWSIKYTCQHHWTARLSTCHATVTIQSKPGKPLKPSCSSTATLTIRSDQACGDCQRAKAEEDLKYCIVTAGLGFFEAEQRREKETYRMFAALSTCRQYRGREEAGKGRCGVREREGRVSLLRREVVPEDVVDLGEEAGGKCLAWGWGDTGSWVSGLVVGDRR